MFSDDVVRLARSKLIKLAFGLNSDDMLDQLAPELRYLGKSHELVGDIDPLKSVVDAQPGNEMDKAQRAFDYVNRLRIGDSATELAGGLPKGLLSGSNTIGPSLAPMVNTRNTLDDLANRLGTVHRFGGKQAVNSPALGELVDSVAKQHGYSKEPNASDRAKKEK